MSKPALVFSIGLALGVISLAPLAAAQSQASREEGPIEIEKCQTIEQIRFRMFAECGDAAQIARAYIVAREVFQLPQLWDELQALDNQVPIDAQEAAYQELRRLVDRATRWLVEARFPIDDVAGEIERFGPTIAHLTPRVPQLLRGVEGSGADLHGPYSGSAIAVTSI